MPESKSSKTLVGLISLVAMSEILTSRDVALAQIRPDRTLGVEQSVVTPNSSRSSKISGGATRGTNLFHSFEQFSVSTGGSAFFSNSPSIQNIINRVTGSSVSNINGLLKANGTANLFLLNPNGIIFGPDASLDVGGSFVASTASSLTFADETFFSTTAPKPPSLLTVDVPLGLQFRTKSGRILVQGYGNGIEQISGMTDITAGLRVPSNQTLALVGGDLALEGGVLKTAGGRIELGSVASGSSVSLTSIDKGFALGYEGVPNFKDIKLSQQAAVDASGSGSGNIRVQGRNVTLTDWSIIETSTLGTQAGGTLYVSGSESVRLSGTSPDARFSTALIAQVYPGATGTGGNIIVKTKQLSLRNGAQIYTGTVGDGDGGSLTVQASKSVELIGTSDIGQVTSGLFSATLPGSTGNAGNITIETGRLDMQAQGTVFSGTFSEGNAGSILISAQDSVELIGTQRQTIPGDFTIFDTSVSTTVHPGATGAGGDLDLKTRRLLVQDGAVISTATFGKERGGNLTIRADDSVKLSGTNIIGSPSLISARSREGKAGDLNIKTRQLTIQDKAQATVRNDGPGNAGNLQINASSLTLDSQGGITASTAGGDGGNITLLDSELLLMRRNSEISATAGGTGAGGNITINSDLIATLEDSDITANAFKGKGGNIEINTQGLFQSPNSDTDASSQLGIDGTVEINTPLDFAKASAPPVITPESPQVSSICQSRSDPEVSNFVKTGTGGTPTGANDLQESSSVWLPQSPQAKEPESLTDDSAEDDLTPVQGWIIYPDGTMRFTTEPGVRYSPSLTSSCKTTQRINEQK